MKCNLDCEYCSTDLYGGHNNSLPHPPLAECLQTIDFMYEYADRMLMQRIPALRYVVLNVYGGEALNHPDIVEILQQARQRHLPYQDRWKLTITVTTNAIAPARKIDQLIPLVDEFTVSWHANNRAKQKQQFRDNVLKIRDQQRRLKCIVMMHPDYFEDAQDQISWCQENNVRYLPKQLDHKQSDVQFNYRENQIIWFKKLYNKQDLVPVIDDQQRADLADTGRACCGGRSLCADQTYRQREKFVNNKFPDWYCSVDKFFLFVKQTTSEIFVNKDCKMNYHGSVGPIGTLDQADAVLKEIGNTPTIQCKKYHCLCGLCAPKAANLDTYNSIIKKYQL